MLSSKKSLFDPHVLFDANSSDWWKRADSLQKIVIVLSGREREDYENPTSLRFPCKLVLGELPSRCHYCMDYIRTTSHIIAPGVLSAYCNSQCKSQGEHSPTYIRATSVEGEFLIAEAIKFIKEHGGHVETMDPAIQSQ